MATTRQPGKCGSRRRRRSALAAGACLVAVCLAGCGGQRSHLAGDPLFGEFGLKQPGPSSPPPASVPPSRTQAGVPPAPSAQFSSTPAALAAGPLPGARPLAIDGANPPNVIPTSAQGAALKPTVQPVPREGSVPGTGVVPVNNTWAPQTAPSVETAVLQQLKVRGVLFHKIDSVPEGVRLSVIVPSRTQPDATRVYEATGRDLAAASEAILQKLDSAR